MVYKLTLNINLISVPGKRGETSLSETITFSAVREEDVTRAIVQGFARQFDDYIESDVIIEGAGPSGLTAGMELANVGRKVLIIERNNYPGGGFWSSGYLMNKVTIRKPAHAIVEELGIPYDEVSDGLCLADGTNQLSVRHSSRGNNSSPVARAWGRQSASVSDRPPAGRHPPRYSRPRGLCSSSAGRSH